MTSAKICKVSPKKVTIIFKQPPGSGASIGHAKYDKLIDVEIGQTKLVHHDGDTRIKNCISQGGYKVCEIQSVAMPSLVISEYTGTKNAVSVQGNRARIPHPDHPKPTIEFIAEQVKKNPSAALCMILEKESVELIPLLKTDPRFADVNFGIVHAGNDDQKFFDKRYKKRNNNQVFRDTKKEQYELELRMALETLRKYPDMQEIVLKRVIRTQNGKTIEDIQYLAEALICAGFNLKLMSKKQSDAKGLPPNKIFFANLDRNDLKDKYPQLVDAIGPKKN